MFLQPLLIFNHYRVVLYASNSTDVYAQALFFYRLVILVLMYVLTCMDLVQHMYYVDSIPISVLQFGSILLVHMLSLFDGY